MSIIRHQANMRSATVVVSFLGRTRLSGTKADLSVISARVRLWFRRSLYRLTTYSLDYTPHPTALKRGASAHPTRRPIALWSLSRAVRCDAPRPCRFRGTYLGYIDKGVPFAASCYPIGRGAVGSAALQCRAPSNDSVVLSEAKDPMALRRGLRSQSP